MFLHERDEFLRSPAFGLEVIIIRGRGSSVHHEIDGRPSSEDVGTGYNGFATSEPFRGAGVVEGSGLAI
jgi:hypothetical protein